MRDPDRRRRPGRPNSSARSRKPPSICRSTSSPSRPTRRSSRCMRTASSSRPTKRRRACSTTRRRKSAISAGFAAYEISNHARAGAECRHNLVYWRGDDYVGIGPGAHGRIVENGRAPRHRDREAARKLADAGGIARPRPGRRRGADARGARRRISADGTAARRRHRARSASKRLPAGRSTTSRIAILRAEGAVETTANGHLRVTQAAFPILDAVVADLAA